MASASTPDRNNAVSTEMLNRATADLASKVPFTAGSSRRGIRGFFGCISALPGCPALAVGCQGTVRALKLTRDEARGTTAPLRVGAPTRLGHITFPIPSFEGYKSGCKALPPERTDRTDRTYDAFDNHCLEGKPRLLLPDNLACRVGPDEPFERCLYPGDAPVRNESTPARRGQCLIRAGVRG